MSTGVICSLLTLTSCDVKKRVYNKENIHFMGVQTELLSLDPLSVNALGENIVLDLISPKIFKFDNISFQLQSPFGEVFFDGKSLGFEKKSVNEKLLKAFEKIKKSVLWNVTFNKLFIENQNKIVCIKTTSCIEDFVSLVGVLRSKSFSSYKVKEFVKTKFVLLEKKENKKDEHNYIKVVNFKKAADAILYLKLKKIDVFYPKGDVGDLDPALTYEKSESKYKRLSLYSKYKKPFSKDFIDAFCASKELIKKTFLEWEIAFNACDDLSNIRFVDSKKLNVISNTNKVNKIFDLLHQYLNETFKLDYRLFKSYKLNEFLKAGDFDLYFTEELYDDSYHIFYEAYHSKGRYNTLEIKNEKLDRELKKLRSAKTYRAFIDQQKQIKDLIRKFEPLLIRLKKKYYVKVYR